MNTITLIAGLAFVYWITTLSFQTVFTAVAYIVCYGAMAFFTLAIIGLLIQAVKKDIFG
jgi:hypothetical protein